jgi:hypothetical protein
MAPRRQSFFPAKRLPLMMLTGRSDAYWQTDCSNLHAHWRNLLLGNFIHLRGEVREMIGLIILFGAALYLAFWSLICWPCACCWWLWPGQGAANHGANKQPTGFFLPTSNGDDDKLARPLIGAAKAGVRPRCMHRNVATVHLSVGRRPGWA